MFSSSTIDGGGAFVPGDDYGAAQEGAEDAWPKEAEEEDFQETPRSLLRVLPALVKVQSRRAKAQWFVM